MASRVSSGRHKPEFVPHLSLSGSFASVVDAGPMVVPGVSRSVVSAISKHMQTTRPSVMSPRAECYFLKSWAFIVAKYYLRCSC